VNLFFAAKIFLHIKMEKKNVLYAVVTVLVIILIFYYLKYSQINTVTEKICPFLDGKCEYYKVHREHHNPEEAAALLQRVTAKNEKLIEFLHEKYSTIHMRDFEPLKKNKIDVIGSSELFIEDSKFSDAEKEYLQTRIDQLMKNYNSDRITEISPLNLTGVTAYSENKRKLVLCLRKKIAVGGKYELHDENTIMYVVLHEMAHMMNDQWGHDPIFWKLFKFLLINADEAGLYKPVDYSKNPIVYCGLKLTYNPYFDHAL
jgi:predicted metal-dependent hydrolase